MSEYVTVWVDDLPDLKRREEITRCVACKYFDQTFFNGICRRTEQPTDVTGFCAWASKREVMRDE